MESVSGIARGNNKGVVARVSRGTVILMGEERNVLGAGVCLVMRG